MRTKSLGFVPTMGALHAGHLSLIRTAARENDVVAVSIFVNPAQFSPTEDLAVYPRTLGTDLALLERLNDDDDECRGRVEALFVPSVAELYPHGIPQEEELQRGAFVTVQPLASRLEGVTRPHFFRGVATVCAKLFNIVQPERAYFGQKDVQQSIVLKRLVRDLCFPVEIRVCPTGREEDGLAMSSRNVYLGERRRKAAPVLYQALRAAEEEYERLKAAGEAVDAGKVRRKGLEVLQGMGGVEESVKVEVEYFSLADTQELEELEVVVDAGKGAVLSAAVKMLPSQDGEIPVRLIDNIILE
jgi:pantoate--beta-alanine ligase